MQPHKRKDLCFAFMWVKEPYHEGKEELQWNIAR